MSTPANPDDLTSWLRAQLDEDERAARAWLPLGNPTAAERDHIARHDPARVLAEVDAKRRILDWIEGVQEAAGDPPGFDPQDAAALTHAARLLALPFADRPGYREEWGPQ